MRLFLSLLLLVLLLPHSYALTPIEANSMEARVLITNTIEFQQTGPGYRIDEASARLTWFPRDDWVQDVKSLEIEPQASVTESGLVFHWRTPAKAQTLQVQSVVVTRNAIVPVRSRIPFPIREVPADVAQYLEAGQIADQSPQIQRLAQELAAGKTDAYEVVFALADWTTSNVEYSLKSLGEPAIQRSSEVIQTRWGKCDELTALFISLNRAVGIPARFVAGYSYTNSDIFQDNWGGHGWAEVWLPDVGWVPFDVTYGEYGYLDAGHVKLTVSPDAKETSIDYSARGNDFRLETEPLDIYVTPLRMAAHTDPSITLTLDAPHDEVGFGSAVLILANVKNNRDYYVSTRLDLAKTSNTALLSDTYENVLLRPREARTIPFLIRIDEQLDRGYRYEFPFRVSSRLGEEATITIGVRSSAPVYDTESFSEYLRQQQTQRQEFTVTCDRGDVVYTGMPVSHTCTVQGLGSRQLASGTVRVCDQYNACESRSYKDGQFTLRTNQSRGGVVTSSYTASIGGKSAIFFVASKTVDPTGIAIAFAHPPTAQPDDPLVIMVNLTSIGAIPEDVNVTLRINNAFAEDRIERLDRPAVLRFSAPGRALRPGDNVIEVLVSYTDELGTAGTASAASSMQLVNVRWTDRVLFWLDDAGHWLVNLLP